MYRDPDLPLSRVAYKLPAELPGLWIEALERPEADLKSRAAQAIALAHERGFPGMDATVGPLTRELDRADQHPTVRVAVARALVVLDAKSAADGLARLAAADEDVRDLVEPALAKWDYRPIRAVWLERIARPPNRRGTILAVRGLAAVKEEKAAPRLRELALGRDVPAAVRLESARALAVIRPAGSEADAQALVADQSPRGITDRLVAASLLRQHQGDEAVRQLQALGRDAEPTVAAIALARLVELNPDHVVPLLDAVLASPDANVRGFGVEVLIHRPTDTHLKLLGDRLNDVHPAVRTRARQGMRDLTAKAELKPVVIREATRVLDGKDWRGLEQAAILLAQLNHKSAASRLVQLLPYDRPEVRVAVGWGLRVLAVPETLGPVLEFFDGEFRAMLPPGPKPDRPPAVDAQLSHLAQFLGQARYRPADALLRRLIPPRVGKDGNPAGAETRAAAVWAVGLIHEGNPDPALAALFVNRLTATRPFDLEDQRVRRMSAVALGQMKAVDELDTIRFYYKPGHPTLDPVNSACGWAIERITGEKATPPPPMEMTRMDWFLVPAK
jgi:HEAT repeat protein